MTTELQSMADELSRFLELDTPPVQISYLNEAPAGVATHPGSVPSVCTFFAYGTQSAFVAPIVQHEDCEIGAFVLGIPPKGELGTRLMGTIGSMQKEGYLNPGEEARVPHNAEAPRFVAYGPLGSLPFPPTGVLIFARPAAAMLVAEAAESGANTPPVPLLTRPMCSILPVLNAGAPVAISLGCTGSRIYTDLGFDKMVVGIRGDQLQGFVERLGRIVHANRWVSQEDSARKSKTPGSFHAPKN
jgi:uncharacterized protein (DUF169 family)